MIYCDTSFLISLYVQDDHTAEAEGRVSSILEPLIWTPWHHLEIRTALAARVGRKQSRQDEVDSVLKLIERHISDGSFLRQQQVNWVETLERAAELGYRHGAQIKCRSLDVVHVALAQNLKSSCFLTMDERQKRLANEVGLSTD